MNRLLTLAALISLSLLLFVAAFSFVHRPLVVGELQKQLDYKLSYARTLDVPKIVIFAGSNGRYSHRCEMFSAALARPCVNASIGVGIGLDFLLEQWRPLLRAGDLVYMPLEYDQYRFSRAAMHGGLQNALLVHYQCDHLRSLGLQRIASAYGSFDLPFLIHAVGEMSLERRGYRRRSSIDNLTTQGDESGHTAQVGAGYAEFLRHAGSFDTSVPARSDSIDVLVAFLRQAQRDGVAVIGGLPTIPDSASPSAEAIERLRSTYERHGQRFVALLNRSRYPLSCFFDTLSHLNEDCQKAHSAAVAVQIAALLARPGQP
jgi:hypothetical protein